MAAGIRTGIDIGGTKLEAAVLDPSGTVLARERMPTPQGGYEALLTAVSELVTLVEDHAGASSEGLGVGTPGSLSPVTGMIRNANSTHLNGQPLDRDLARRLGRQVVLDNDANCFALAEAKAGAGRGHGVVFGVILGTGVGAGLVVGGRCLTGANRIGGEWGHNPLPAPAAEELPGPKCYCGRRGCIEAWCSGPALAADHFRLAGSDMPPEMIAAFAASGDMAARETLDRHEDRLVRALAGVVNIVDPDVIVLGGGLSNLACLYKNLPGKMRDFVFSDCFQTPIMQNELGDSAGVIGAAWLCPTEENV